MCFALHSPMRSAKMNAKQIDASSAIHWRHRLASSATWRPNSVPFLVPESRAPPERPERVKWRPVGRCERDLPRAVCMQGLAVHGPSDIPLGRRPESDPHSERENIVRQRGTSLSQHNHKQHPLNPERLCRFSMAKITATEIHSQSSSCAYSRMRKTSTIWLILCRTTSKRWCCYTTAVRTRIIQVGNVLIAAIEMGK